MEQSVAIRLINRGIAKSLNTHWADLGAGSGVFTKALATCLGKGNTIYAIDQNETELKSVENDSSQTVIVKMKVDFVLDKMNLPPLDGILMANSLHYVKDKYTFVERLKLMLKPEGRLIIIEYDTLVSNQWVPYPINFSSLEELMKDFRFSTMKLGEQPSQYRQGNMYSALVQ